MQNRRGEGLTSPQAKEYQAMKNRLFLLNLALQFLFLYAAAASGVSLFIKNSVLGITSVFYLVNASYFFFFSIIAFCLFFPLDVYEGFILEHRYGLSRQNFFAWFKDSIKKGIVTFIFSLIMLEAVYFFLLKTERGWWFWA
ncbi:MAG TPA: hypothetical protein PLU24_05900, partial [Candidatus Omnitrophota bacterium]|nr:hypothetical protein [Candidatus Omnitrophota bacterium]